MPSRVQQDLHGHRGFAGDPLYRARRTLHTGAGLITDRQRARIHALFADDAHVQVEVTWGVCQAVIAAYRHPDPTTGRSMMTKLIASVSRGVPTALSEVTTLGRTLKKRAADVLAYFDRPGTSDGPTEAICDSNTYAAPHSGFATSPATSPEASSRPAASDPDYTLDRDEPGNLLVRTCERVGRAAPAQMSALGAAASASSANLSRSGPRSTTTRP